MCFCKCTLLWLLLRLENVYKANTGLPILLIKVIFQLIMLLLLKLSPLNLKDFFFIFQWNREVNYIY